MEQTPQNQDWSFGDSDLKRFEEYRITDMTDVPLPKDVLTISGSTIAVNGDIFTISGESKGGKSAVMGMCISGVITTTGVVNDGLDGMQILPNNDRHAVIHFDTEQARHKHKYNVQTIIRRAELSTCPDHFLSYNIRKLNIDDYQEKTTGICDAAYKKFGGIHSIWIDGGADYVTDVNDQERSNEVISYFEHLAIEYDTAVFLVVHTNPGSNKERGHFGSQCQRKSGGILRVKSSGDQSIVEGDFLRYTGKQNLSQLSFKYDTEKGYHVGCGSVSVDVKEGLKANEKREKAARICKEVFGSQKSYKYDEALKKIGAVRSCSERTAKTDFSLMRVNDMIIQGSDNRWRLNNEYFS